MKTTETLVLFWRTAEIYSNWNPAQFVDENGQPFDNSEQFMMWAKALLMGDCEMAAAMLLEANPEKLKKLGRQVKNWNEALWKKYRLPVMVHGCYLKFSHSAARRAEMLATGERVLVEASPEDRIWGIGLEESDPRCLDKMQWDGLNLLGEALMIVRTLLRDNLPLPQEYMEWKTAA
jgi:ribA/ribD-fused uncharacterized protein